eukprot:3025598-Alexandrium_andersonii.AAC.1
MSQSRASRRANRSPQGAPTGRQSGRAAARNARALPSRATLRSLPGTSSPSASMASRAPASTRPPGLRRWERTQRVPPRRRAASVRATAAERPP